MMMPAERPAFPERTSGPSLELSSDHRSCPRCGYVARQDDDVVTIRRGGFLPGSVREGDKVNVEMPSGALEPYIVDRIHYDTGEASLVPVENSRFRP